VAVALLLAGLVIQRVLLRATSTNAAVPLLVLCATGVAAGLLVHRCSAGTPGAQTAGAPGLRLFWAVWGAAYIGVVLAAVAARTVSSDPQRAQWIWGVAVVLPVAALLVESIARGTAVRGRSVLPWRDCAIAVALFATALVVRGVHITASPSFVHVDEANCGLSAEAFMHGLSLLSLGFFNLPMMSYAYLSLGLHLFSDPVVGIRWANAVLGSIGVVLLYFLGAELFGRRTGVIAAVLLCFAFLHVEFSRDGIHNIQAPTAFTLTMLLLVLSLRRGGALTALLLGLVCALDFQVYWAARVATGCAALYVAVYLIHDRRLVFSRWQEALWALVGLFVGFVPVFALYRWRLDLLLYRERQLSLFTVDPGTRSHIKSLYHTLHMGPILWLQFWRTVSTFNYTPDASPQIGWPGPMLDWVTAALLPAAVALAVLNARRPQYQLPLIWAGSLVAAGVVSADPPWWPRLLAMLPAVLLLIAVLLDRAVQPLTKALDDWRFAWASIAVALVLSCAANLKASFWDFPAATAASSERESTLVARFLAHAPGAQQTVLLSNPSLFITFQTIQFIAPDAGGCTVLTGQSLNSCANYRASRLFVALPDRIASLQQVEQQRPGGRLVLVGTLSHPVESIWAYELTR
jgi:hypothetical protein